MPSVSRDQSLPPSASIESIRRSIEALVAVRQRLRAEDAGPLELERNRRAIVRSQWELSAALIAARAA
ncbi:MAG: hypothetical protein ACXWZ8_07825 [Gaiellaceae bacterium]